MENDASFLLVVLLLIKKNAATDFFDRSLQLSDKLFRSELTVVRILWEREFRFSFPRGNYVEKIDRNSATGSPLLIECWEV